MLKPFELNRIIYIFMILCLTIYPIAAESTTGNISGKIVSTPNAKSSPTPSSSEKGSGGSGGGGGGGGGPPLFNSTFSNAFVTSKYVYTPNKSVPLRLSKTYTNLTDITGASIVVDTPLYIDFRFANVIKLPGIDMPKNAYRVYEFVFTKFGTRTKVEPKSVIITFRVPNEWIKKPEDIKLFEYKNNSWVEHPTEMLGVNGSFTYYKSSINHSGFYYLGYPSTNESTKNQIGESNQKFNQTNSSKTSSEFSSELNSNQSVSNQTSPKVNTTNQPIQNTEKQNTTTPTNALQESLIGDVLNDIINFISNLIQMVKGLFKI